MRLHNRSWIIFLIFLGWAFTFPHRLLAFTPSAEDITLLKKIEQDSIQYFVRMSDKTTGLTRDSSQPGSPASIAATGFSLAAFAIGQSHGWIPKDYAYDRIRLTLQTLLHKAEHQNGFFYHFLDTRSAKRVWGSEASSIDTALLIAGALVASQYFPDTEIDRMTQAIYERVNWEWMMNRSSLICMGWKPESGFLPYYWDTYNELIILHALAIGAPAMPVPAEAWNAWLRNEDAYNGRPVIYSHSGSLFTYQFAQAFIDFKKIDDRGVNYFDNSVNATLANRDYSLSFRDQHKTYSEDSWGLSASLGPGGYRAYGAKPGEGTHDGTIAPYAALSSIVFTPEQSVRATNYFYRTHGNKLYGHFGFKDAFNLDKQWWAQEYLGIDQGITVLMLENFLNDGMVWNHFMRLDAVERWIRLCDLGKTE